MKRLIVTALLLAMTAPAVAIEQTLTQASPTSAAVNCPQGRTLAYVYRGTFDSATAKVQSQDADADWNDVVGTSETAAAAGSVLCFTDGEQYRVTTTGGGGSQSLEVELETVKRQ